MKYYTSMKMTVIYSHIYDIILSERRKTQKSEYCMISFIESSKTGKGFYGCICKWQNYNENNKMIITEVKIMVMYRDDLQKF